MGEMGWRSAQCQVYRDAADEWRWRLVARNGRVIADSGEGYTRETDAVRAAQHVMKIAGHASLVVVGR